MKRSLFFLLVISLFGLISCDKKEEIKPQEMPDGAHVVQVEDRVDASDYSYIQVSEKGKSNYWIAVTKLETNKGDILYFTKSMEMKNFHSKTLDRTFETVLFVDDIRKTPHNNMQNNTQNQVTSPHSQVQVVPKIDVKVEPVKGGKTVDQIYSEKDMLSGKTVRVKGKVTKFNPEIMERNWIHIQDGTGSKDGYDLMITSSDVVMVGQVIIAEGKVAVNKDFGAGYSYKVMIEDARIKVDGK